MTETGIQHKEDTPCKAWEGSDQTMEEGVACVYSFICLPVSCVKYGGFLFLKNLQEMECGREES